VDRTVLVAHEKRRAGDSGARVDDRPAMVMGIIAAFAGHKILGAATALMTGGTASGGARRSAARRPSSFDGQWRQQPDRVAHHR
jgi:hypothetical protein